ncbi:MAG: molybdopterin-dependent oxidoreductase [Desulfuromonadaceae bacterium]|nr:molybdopterin-dependent oxidoreductase [Desulfuromonas sp.]MDY0185517.1 molybdopterin-dependent oxidoreductase [Desulfuromonadaceae bacterium]
MSHKAEKKMIRLTIDGQDVEIEAGLPIIAAAEKLGIKIPTMCYLKKVSTTGACRVCLVKVEGVDASVTACNTIAVDGIKVTTSTPEIERQRRDMIRLMLLNHPLDCTVCDAAGECDLQDICFDHHVLDQPFKAEDVAMPKIRNWPLIENVPARCILCEKCVKVGHELTGIGDFYVNEFGDKAYIERHEGQNTIDPYIEGNAVAVCPVGAMISKPYRHKARCWTLDKVPSLGFAGGSLEQVELNVKNGQLYRITSEDEVTTNNGLLSFDSSFGYGFVNSTKRLGAPLVAGAETDWDTALNAVDQKARSLGGEAVAGLTSARLTLEENYLFQKLFRVGYSSNNIDSAACFGVRAASETLRTVLGLSGSSAPAADIANADAVLVFGSDITSEQPQINYQIQRALRHNDAYLCVANMRSVRIGNLANLRLNYAPGTEVALIAAIVKLMIEQGLVDNDFVKKFIKNGADIKKSVANIDVKKVAAETGVDFALLQEAAQKFGAAQRVAVVFGADVTGAAAVTDIVAALANFSMVSGALNGDGGGVFMVDERPNTQGLLDAGVSPQQLPGGLDYVGKSADVAAIWGCASLPQNGRDAVQILEGIEAGVVKFLYLAGVNPLVTYPESQRWRAALKKVEFLVVQDILESELTDLANVVLPAASFAEKTGSYIACDNTVGLLQQALKPFAAAKADGEIIAALLGAATGKSSCADAVAVRNELNTLSGMFTTTVISGDKYLTSGSKKAYSPAPTALKFSEFKCANAEDKGAGHTLIVGKMHAHTGVTSTYAAGALEIAPQGYVEINSQDAQQAGISEGATLTVKSAVGSFSAPARISSYVPAGILFAPYHFADIGAMQAVPVGHQTVRVEISKG